MKRSIFVLAVAFLLATIAPGQTSSTDDDAAIKATALNYIEGWYEGDAARMESALHPERHHQCQQRESHEDHGSETRLRHRS